MQTIEHGTLILPDGRKEADLMADAGIIKEIRDRGGFEGADFDGASRIDAEGCFVYPAFINIDPVHPQEDIRSYGADADRMLPRLKEALENGTAITTEELLKDRDFSLRYRIVTGQVKNVFSVSQKNHRWEIIMKLLQNDLDPVGFARLLAENPARMLGVYPKKGAICVGSDADLLVIDPNVNGKVCVDRGAGNVREILFTNGSIRALLFH
jgi:dihydroorotase-like cyclic amidohydrolase